MRALCGLDDAFDTGEMRFLESDAAAREFLEQSDVVDDRIAAFESVANRFGRTDVASGDLASIRLCELVLTARPHHNRGFVAGIQDRPDEVVTDETSCAENRHSHTQNSCHKCR